MSIITRINDDVKSAMKNKESEKLLALRTLSSEIKNVSIRNGRKESTEEDALQAVTKAIKQREDAAEQFSKGRRMDLAMVERSQIELFKVYLPEQMAEGELRTLISETISQVGATTKKDMGKVMKELSPKIKGKADMKLVNSIIGEFLV